MTTQIVLQRLRVLSLALLTTLLTGQASEARLLRIIHTNDLHGHYDHAPISEKTGGYAAVKSVIDALKADAKTKSIDTLTLDAGDFSEGSQYYFADEGADSWQMMTEMGYDAITLGNHDWLVGARRMDKILSMVNPTVPFLSANFEYKKEFTNIKNHIFPYKEFEKAGSKIAILGLSTNNMMYKWLVREGSIGSPSAAAEKYLRKLREDNDYVIALTHLGFKKDKILAKDHPGIDLVVGGHSHTLLKQPFQQFNLDEKSTPIVQTGEHGQFVGNLLVDLVPGKPLKIISYELVPVHADGPKDNHISDLIKLCHQGLESYFGASWLSETIATSASPLARPRKTPTLWGYIFGDSIRESAGADLALDSTAFHTDYTMQGAITRELIIRSYPRVFDFEKKFGWNVWTIRAPGWLIKGAIELTAATGKVFVTSSNVTYDIETKGKIHSVTNFRISGRKVDPLKVYTVAVSEGLGRGSDTVSKLLRSIFKPADTGVPVWAAMEEKLRQMKTIP